MGKIVVRDNEYELIVNNKEAFDNAIFTEMCTDYFDSYDYIIGDIAYGKLRLKGFYDGNNKEKKDFNDYQNKDEYLKNNCAVDCKYFILKKI